MQTITTNNERKQLLAPDDVIANQYRIIELLGQPDKAQLYKAVHIPSGTSVALKILMVKNLSEELQEKFKARAKALISLKHPNIVATKDYGILENGLLYLVTDHIEGQTLAHVLKEQGRLDFETAMPIFRQICIALSYMHKQCVAHGAISPRNILVTGRPGYEVVRLANFRVAQFARLRANEIADPEFGEIFANSIYMSPEECQGGAITGASDIYLFGCVIYRAMTGITTVYGQKGSTAIYLHVYEPPCPFSRLVINGDTLEDTMPDYLEQVILKAVEKGPYYRYHSAEKLLKALEFVQDFAKDKASLISLSLLARWVKQAHLRIRHYFRAMIIGKPLPSAIPHGRDFTGFYLSKASHG